MGDSSLTTILSVVSLVVIAVAIGGAVLAWRFGRRTIRTAVAILLIVVGVASLLSPIGMLLSIAGSGLIALIGAVLLIAEYARKGAG